MMINKSCISPVLKTFLTYEITEYKESKALIVTKVITKTKIGIKQKS